MEDGFLHDLRRDPSPEFARRLRATLVAGDAYTAVPWLGPRATRWFASAVSVALVAIAFSFPAVRAGAQAFLDLFRVGGFVGVTVDAERLRAIDANGLDLPAMLGDEIEVLTEPGEPVTVESLEAAEGLAGFDVDEPAWLPVGWQRQSIAVTGEGAFRVTASTGGLEYLLAALEIDDLTVPDGLDGETVDFRMSPVVRSSYGAEGSEPARQTVLLQAPSPEVTFPAGVDLPALAEIALRVLGLDREEAYRLAWTVDWRSTLLVPIPAVEASFRDVDIAGSDGLLVEAQSGDRIVLWARSGRVFALHGRLDDLWMLEMAQSTQ